jgi:hypothetical protein
MKYKNEIFTELTNYVLQSGIVTEDHNETIKQI